jgi:hypothetical protein
VAQDIADSNYWEPLADAFDDDDADEDEPVTDQVQLDHMAERFKETCHMIATEKNLHQRQAGLAPPRVKAGVKRAIHQRREAFQ